MRSAAIWVLFGGLLWSVASKAEQPLRFHLVYRGSASCQQETELLTEIEKRSQNSQRIMDGSAGVSVRVSIEASAGQQLATVDIDGPDGVSQRTLAAPSCAQLTRALALILTIAIDPDARSEDVVARASATPPSLGGATPRRVAEPPAARPAPWWAVGVGVGLSGGVAPHPAFDQALSLELGRGRRAGFAAHVRLSGLHAHGSVDALAGTADFDLLALRLASCPYRIGTRISLAACVSFDFGRLQGSGSQTRAERTSSAYWYGPGAFGAVTLSALPWLRVQLELGALAPLARDRFYFGPSETVHGIPALAGYGGINLLVGG
jgi:hypothetical protein